MTKNDIAIFAGGCFWCLEPVFSQLAGVKKVESGYIGGYTENPSYKQVCTGTTGHAEAIRISFDVDVISYGELLEVFFTAQIRPHRIAKATISARNIALPYSFWMRRSNEVPSR